MSTEATHRATVKDLYRVIGDDDTYELVGGRLVRMAPAGYGHTRISDRIRDALVRYEDETGGGFALSDGVGYLVDVPGRQSFSPDASLSPVEPDDDEDFVTGAPVFAAEIRSKHDYGASGDAEAAAKRADYFAAGTRVVWDVNPRAQTITRYTSDAANTVRVFEAGEIADAEPALPGWRVPVDAIFARRASLPR